VRAEERSVVAGLDRREVFDPRLDPVGDPMENRGALFRWCAPPRLGRSISRGDRQVYGVCVATRNLRDRLFVDRGDVGEPIGRSETLAADQVVGRDLDPFDDRALVRRLLQMVRMRTVWPSPGPCQSEPLLLFTPDAAARRRPLSVRLMSLLQTVMAMMKGVVQNKHESPGEATVRSSKDAFDSLRSRPRGRVAPESCSWSRRPLPLRALQDAPILPTVAKPG